MMIAVVRADFLPSSYSRQQKPLLLVHVLTSSNHDDCTAAVQSATLTAATLAAATLAAPELRARQADGAQPLADRQQPARVAPRCELDAETHATASCRRTMPRSISSTSSATASGVNDCNGLPVRKDLWYEWTAPSTNSVRFETGGTNADGSPRVVHLSNLCTEILEYTSPDEVAVCNLASTALPRLAANGVSSGSDGTTATAPASATDTTHLPALVPSPRPRGARRAARGGRAVGNELPGRALPRGGPRGAEPRGLLRGALRRLGEEASELIGDSIGAALSLGFVLE